MALYIEGEDKSHVLMVLRSFDPWKRSSFMFGVDKPKQLLQHYMGPARSLAVRIWGESEEAKSKGDQDKRLDISSRGAQL
jgi:hypothetical protein